jgi:hypothetical protein
MFGSFLPGLGWLAPPKSIRAWEPTLLWNQLHSFTLHVLTQKAVERKVSSCTGGANQRESD